MTTTNHSTFFPFLIDLNKDDQSQQIFMSIPQKFCASSSSSSSLSSYPIFTNISQESQIMPFQHKKRENSGSSISLTNHISSDHSFIRKYEDQRNPSTLQVGKSCNKSSYMINSDCMIRVCADCNTTKTPLWRSGPTGPKSLCNACGIRQRKARRALMASSSSGTIITTHDKPITIKNKVKSKDKHINVKKYSSHQLPVKKRSKFKSKVRTIDKKRKSQLHVEELMTILGGNSAFQQVCNQDEKEGAILLMALSYGLVGLGS